MDDQRPAHDTVGTALVHRNALGRERGVEHRISLGIRIQVAEVAAVVVHGGWIAMGVAGRVEVAAGAAAIRCAAITNFVHMESVLPRLQALDAGINQYAVALLYKTGNAAHRITLRGLEIRYCDRGGWGKAGAAGENDSTECNAWKNLHS